MIYAGQDRSVNCAAQTLKLVEQVSELCHSDFEIDQLDVIYAGPGRLVNYAARTLKLTSEM